MRFVVIPKVMLVTLFLLIFLSVGAHSKVYISGENFSSKITQYENYQELHIRGNFQFEDQKYFDSIIDNLVRDKRILLSLDHFGGLSFAHKIFVKKINKFCREDSMFCTIDTIVKRNNHCGSACIPVYMMGRYRMAARHSTFGFHASYSGPIDFPNYAMDLYDVAGVNKNWIDKNEHLFATSEKYTQLMPSSIKGSNIVMIVTNFTSEVHEALNDKWYSGKKLYNIMRND